MSERSGASWHHTGLAVSDLDAAIRFYRDAFGFEVVFEDRDMQGLIEKVVGIPGLNCQLAQLRSPLGQQVLELIAFQAGPSGHHASAPITPGTAHVSIQVDDLDREIERLTQLGATVLGQVTAFPDGRSVYLRDPSGTFIELDEPSR